jgi:hypothetical protein
MGDAYVIHAARSGRGNCVSSEPGHHAQGDSAMEQGQVTASGGGNSLGGPGGGGGGDAGIAALFDFSFNRFITLSVIKVVYLLGMVIIALMWLIAVISAFTQGALQGLGVLVVGTLFAILYLIFFRIWLELIVVIFRIGENTSRMVGRSGLNA